MSNAAIEKLTSGRLLARNTIYNLAGTGGPLLVALFAIPLIIKGMGMDRFGVLSLAWMIVGYLSLFDLGLGQALTQLVSEKLGSGKESEIPEHVWTGMFMMLLLGFVGAGVGFLVSPLLVDGVLKIPAELRHETLLSFYLLSAIMPVVITNTAFQGILAAHQRFGFISAVRIPMGVFTFLGPLMVLPFYNSLTAVVAILVAGRIAAWLANLILCLYVMPVLKDGVSIRRAAVAPLLRFGSWMTVSNIISPLLTSLDRFMIGALVSVTAVAYYTTPCDMVGRLGIIPQALIGVLFPAFSSSFVQDRSRTVQLFGRGIKYLIMVLFPVILVIVALSHEGLALWLGAGFADNSARALQWLATGIFINSLARMPFVLVLSVGRPDLTARLHLAEALFYIPALWWAVGAHGIEGAAVVWTARIAVDAAVLFVMVRRLLPEAAPAVRMTGLAVGASIAAFVAGAALGGTVAKVVFILAVLLVFYLAAWFRGLALDERAFVQKHLRIASS